MQLAATLALLCAAAPGARPLRLPELLEEVSARAPILAARAEAIRAAEAGVGVAGAWEDPTVSVMGEELGGSGSTMPGEEELMPMFSYGLRVPLNLFGRRGLAKQAASARVAARRADHRRADWDGRSQAVAAFYELWMTEEMDAVLGRQLSLLAGMRDAAKARYAAGLMMGHHDFLRAQAESARMEAERASLADEREALVTMLNVLRGAAPESPLGSPELPERAPLPPLAELLAAAPRRPELEAMRAMEAEAGAQRELARRMYLPMVMASGAYEHRLGEAPDSLAGELAFTVPLFFWDRQRHEVEMAEAMERGAAREREAMAAMTDAELRMAWSRARAAERGLAALEETALPRLRETVQSAEAEYRSGAGGLLPLLEAAMAQKELEGRRLGAVLRRATTRFELQRLLGGASAGER